MHNIGKHTTFFPQSTKGAARRIFEVEMQCREVVGSTHEFAQLQDVHGCLQALIPTLQLQHGATTFGSIVFPFETSVHSDNREVVIDSLVCEYFVRVAGVALQRI